MCSSCSVLLTHEPEDIGYRVGMTYVHLHEKAEPQIIEACAIVWMSLNDVVNTDQKQTMEHVMRVAKTYGEVSGDQSVVVASSMLIGISRKLDRKFAFGDRSRADRILILRAFRDGMRDALQDNGMLPATERI